jgi:4-hydroxy-2-oxoheptanedioate aldolase
MRENVVLRAWRDGQATVGAWLSLPNSFSAELMAHQGFDWLTIDMQHGLIDYADVVTMLQAISTTPVTPFVRVPWNDPATIMKVLDAGAYGVVVPLVNNADEAERAVGACRYPPRGFRSSGPIRAAIYGGAGYQAEAARNIACILMIETRDGIANLDEILSVDGVDAIYIGPSDLSYALGMPPRMDNEDPEHQATVDQILQACRRHNVAAGIHTGGPAFSARWLDAGFQMVTLTSDANCMVRSAQELLRDLRERTGLASGVGERAQVYLGPLRRPKNTPAPSFTGRGGQSLPPARSLLQAPERIRCLTGLRR